MLILTRRFGEKIMVGDDVVITVIKMDGGKVRLGIQAPEDMDIYREEVFKRLQEEKRGNANQFSLALNNEVKSSCKR